METHLIKSFNDFKDKSMLRENISQAKTILKKHHLDTSDLRYKSIIEFLGNNQGFAGKFVQWAIEDGEKIDSLKDAYNDYLELKQKNIPFPAIDTFKTLEEFSDKIYMAKKDQVIKQTFKNIPSDIKKYINQDIQDLISNNAKYAKYLISFLGNKGRAFKSSKELYDVLVAKIEEYSKGWNFPEYYTYFKENFSDKDAEVIYPVKKDPKNPIFTGDERILVVDVKNFKASEKMGNDGVASKDWCITRGLGSWDSYVSKGLSKQYYVYDFSKTLGDPMGKIATTISKNDDVTEGRDAKDHAIPNVKEYFEKELGL
jgi:hypothetical protein